MGEAAPALPLVESRARKFFASPLFRVLFDHYEAFVRCYPSRFQGLFGLFRSIVDATVDRFQICGDPREGVAVYRCDRCHHQLTVPFSCKTRLFCPSCHSKRVVLWGEDILDHLLANVPHRFWTFSIPKRLRPYFLHNRKLLSHLVSCAHQTFALALGNGEIHPNHRPALITLIQTFGTKLNWHCHLHLLAGDGVFTSVRGKKIVFHPCQFWDVAKMTEIFRFLLIERLHKARVLSDDTATNLMSWPHSGFHIHHSEPFSPKDRDGFLRRLAYAFRTPVSLSRLSYDGENRVTLSTPKGDSLEFTPLDFLAHLTLHIPDRYQHMRRYAGLYASATRRYLGLPTKTSVVQTDGKPITPRWASLLARIFGTLPIECPRCKIQMKLSGFETDLRQILALIPELSRAPPRKKMETFFDVHEKVPFLVAAEEIDSYESEADISQARAETDHDSDQTQDW